MREEVECLEITVAAGAVVVRQWFYFWKAWKNVQKKFNGKINFEISPHFLSTPPLKNFSKRKSQASDLFLIPYSSCISSKKRA